MQDLPGSFGGAWLHTGLIINDSKLACSNPWPLSIIAEERPQQPSTGYSLPHSAQTKAKGTLPAPKEAMKIWLAYPGVVGCSLRPLCWDAVFLHGITNLALPSHCVKTHPVAGRVICLSHSGHVSTQRALRGSGGMMHAVPSPENDQPDPSYHHASYTDGCFSVMRLNCTSRGNTSFELALMFSTCLIRVCDLP